jgi:asparagine synthase (glutamine-hydrolysing)
MCGIIAILSKDRPVTPEVLLCGIDCISYRGPDERGYWISSDKRIGLAHARLSVVDLTTGQQPISNEDHRLQIVVSGEFYDDQRIRRDLQQRGHRLRSRSDSEIAIHLYEEFGTACLKHLRGEFAFVLWDERNTLLFAARDRFGIRPLYYTVVGETLYLASEAKALFAVGAPARWDYESFFQSCHISLDQDRSLFQGVCQVPPGHFLLASPHHIQTIRYWDLDYPVAGACSRLSKAECVEAVAKSLKEAVDLRLRADVPVGCYLSGGLDSATLLGIAAMSSRRSVDAFTVRFDHPDYDEGPAAEKAAKRLRATYHPLALTQELLADHFSDAVWHGETIAWNSNAIAKYLLSALVREMGVKVVLTGEGADEVFGGYPYIRRDMLLYNSVPKDRATLDRFARESPGFAVPSGNVPALPTESVRRILGFVPSLIETLAEAGARQRRFFNADFLAEFKDRDPYCVFLSRLDVQGQLAGRDPVNQSLYLLTKSMLPNYLLSQLGDRSELAHSVEGRLPYLDHILVELVREIPAAIKFRGSTEKHLLREAAKAFAPNPARTRRKSVFWGPPIAMQTEGQLYRRVEEILRSSIMGSVPFYDQSAVVRVLDTAPLWRYYPPDALMGISRLLMSTASVCILHDRFRL